MATDLELALAHKYKQANGSMGINVTSVTGMLDIDGKSSRMAGAAAKLTKEGKNHRHEWTDKMHRGTRIHAHCEAWLREEDVEAQPDEAPYLDALATFFKEKNPYPLEIERVVLSWQGYGGRFDFIARIGEKTILVDVKTGRPYPLEHAMQLAAYRYADGMAVYGDDGNLLRVDPLPPIDAAGCLYLSDDGTYDFVIYDTSRAVHVLFCDLLRIQKKLPDIKELIGA